MFGVIRYFRTYMREVAATDRRGFHPLDASLGLIKDRLSWNVLMSAARRATKMAFAEAKATLDMSMPNAPSRRSLHRTCARSRRRRRSARAPVRRDLGVISAETARESLSGALDAGERACVRIHAVYSASSDIRSVGHSTRIPARWKRATV
jgi:hypothetical protein